jgi:ATP-binding cassette subfamily C (CFTR/MRP) protein 1
MLLPRALAAISDSRNAFERLTKVFEAPLMAAEPFRADPGQALALDVRGATFEWEETMAEKERREAEARAKKKGGKDKDARKDKGKGAVVGEKAAERKVQPDAAPFRVRDVTMQVPRGSLVAIVGPVGSGAYTAMNEADGADGPQANRVCSKVLSARCARYSHPHARPAAC